MMVLIIAGKGHEQTQTIGIETLPFDDVSVVKNTLDRLCLLYTSPSPRDDL